jgi:hypothetical protein
MSKLKVHCLGYWSMMCRPKQSSLGPTATNDVVGREANQSNIKAVNGSRRSNGGWSPTGGPAGDEPPETNRTDETERWTGQADTDERYGGRLDRRPVIAIDCPPGLLKAPLAKLLEFPPSSAPVCVCSLSHPPRSIEQHVPEVSCKADGIKQPDLFLPCGPARLSAYIWPTPARIVLLSPPCGL